MAWQFSFYGLYVRIYLLLLYHIIICHILNKPSIYNGVIPLSNVNNQFKISYYENSDKSKNNLIKYNWQ